MRTCALCSECGGADRPAQPERREFMGRVVPMALAALAGVALTPDLEAASASRAADGAGPGERRYPVPPGDGVVVDRDEGVVLVRQGGRAFAFALACPHEGAGVRWRQAELRFRCPRHESTYQIDGTLIEGKAKRNMDRLPIRKEGSELVVDPSAPIRSDRQRDAWLTAIVTL